MSTVLEALTGHPYPVPDVNDGQQSTDSVEKVSFLKLPED